MPTKKTKKQITSFSVRKFYKLYQKELQLELIAGKDGLDRTIREPTVNRPGLALSGFYTYFASKRIQVIGNAEVSYLNGFTPEERRKRFKNLLLQDIPCVVIARGRRLQSELLEIANRIGVAVFKTPAISMNFINAATLRLEWNFAPQTSEHGCMVDVKGIGVLVRGKSGIGKSECALGLIERGASLVADDHVSIRCLEGRELIGTPAELSKYHMEVRGLGLINVAALYGISTIRLEKRLDLVVTLKAPEKNLADLERLGMEQKTYSILGVELPHIELPVAGGRDMSRIVEVSALDQRLRSFGFDTANEFNKKLLKMIEEKSAR